MSKTPPAEKLWWNSKTSKMLNYYEPTPYSWVGQLINSVCVFVSGDVIITYIKNSISYETIYYI